MRWIWIAAMAALLPAWGMGRAADTVGDCAHPIEAALRTRGTIVIESRPAQIVVEGTDAETVHVTCTVNAEGDPRDIELDYAGNPDYARLTIRGGGPVHDENLSIHVAVPRKVSLRLFAPAGQVTVRNVAGDKDIDLYAGQITIGMAGGGTYRSMEASVDIGQVSASALGVDKGGFFRTLRRETPDGEYRLRVHVVTGQIELQ